jgi:hypothetical protein
MNDTPPLPATQTHCTQCGGELHPDEGQIFLTCPYCSSTVYLDKSQVVFHWYLASTLDEAKARSVLARWMGGNQTVKDLDKKSTVTEATFQYFPMWVFKRRTPDGQETVLLEPAAAISVSELRKVNLPAGDLRKYDSSLDAQAVSPTVPLEAALQWQEERNLPENQVIEKFLVHLPVYFFRYDYKGKGYLAVIEAGTGQVFANLFPAKAEMPYRSIGLAAALMFLCLATFPVVGALMGESQLLAGALLCLGLGVVISPILFAIALWIAAKI